MVGLFLFWIVRTGCSTEDATLSREVFVSRVRAFGRERNSDPEPSLTPQVPCRLASPTVTITITITCTCTSHTHTHTHTHTLTSCCIYCRDISHDITTHTHSHVFEHPSIRVSLNCNLCTHPHGYPSHDRRICKHSAFSMQDTLWSLLHTSNRALSHGLLTHRVPIRTRAEEHSSTWRYN